ncbi:MAG: hypothetical protein GEU71_18885, partial [Actinobacteria bacterium]|nr:hypothetical protein [Actinomycetota bacterium]
GLPRAAVGGREATVPRGAGAPAQVRPWRPGDRIRSSTVAKLVNLSPPPCKIYLHVAGRRRLLLLLVNGPRAVDRERLSGLLAARDGQYSRARTSATVSVPDFQTIMRPTLVALDTDVPVSVQDIRTSVAVALDVSDQDLAELLGSGKQTRFANRVGWALTHMGKAGLVERSSRGYYTITSREGKC